MAAFVSPHITLESNFQQVSSYIQLGVMEQGDAKKESALRNAPF